MDIVTTSYLRANIFAWLPIGRKDAVLYIGQEDVIVKKLREMSDNVACVRQTNEIPAQAKYRYILCLGDIRTNELPVYAAHLSGDGKLALAVSNAYGLKYLAGVKERGLDSYFGSVEGVQGAEGYTKEMLADALLSAGFAWHRFYYPFPDYLFTMSVYSDACLPKQGELIDQVGNFESERLVLFDEAKAADALLARGKFSEFANAYLVVAGKEGTPELKNGSGEEILFVKFSNDRGETHNIRTYITQSADGKRRLIKAADTIQALPQIDNLEKTRAALSELYADSRFSFNVCSRRADGMEFAFLRGHTMEEELDGLLLQGDLTGASARLSELFQEIRACRRLEPFKETQAFQSVFGHTALPEGILAAPAADIDMILSNIIVGEDGVWTVIDYEWSFHFPIPVNFILYRVIRYYAETTQARRALDAEALYQTAGIAPEERTAYAAMEEAFQEYVLSGHKPMRRLYQEAGRPAYHISSLLHTIDGLERRSALQIYFDRGEGFSERDTVVYHSQSLDGAYCLEINIPGDVRQVRIDPGSQACTVDLKRLAFYGQKDDVLEFISNGHKLFGNCYLFDTDDPNLLLTQLPAANRTLCLDLRIEGMSLAAAEWIAPKIDAKYRLKKMLKL